MTLYETLGVANDATDNQIKEAYRKKAMELHPDRGGSDADFQELQRAYEVLSNPERRAQYDETGFVDGVMDNIHQMLANLFSMLLETEDIHHEDLVQKMRDNVQHAIADGNHKIAHAESEVANLTRALQRIKCKHNKNFLASVVQQKIDAHISGMNTLRSKIDEAKQIGEMIKDYRYEYDARMPSQTINIGGFSMQNFGLGGRHT